MAAQMLLSALPAAEITLDRKTQLKELIERLSETGFDPDGLELVAEGNLTAFRETLIACLDVLERIRERDDVAILHWRGTAYPLAYTGGLSWGDAPTEAFDAFGGLGNCEPVLRQLKAWALADCRTADMTGGFESPPVT